MTKKLQKSFRKLLSKIKSPAARIQLPTNHPISSPKKVQQLLTSGCKHTKTISFAADRSDENEFDNAATLSDVDRFLFENFRSLYLREDEHDHYFKTSQEQPHNNQGQTDLRLQELKESGDHMFFDILPCGLRGGGSVPKRFDHGSSGSGSGSGSGSEALASVFSTSDEGGSSSISTLALSASCRYKNIERPFPLKNVSNEDCIALYTCSPIPYLDFKKSMKEMVEARLRNQEKVDWEFMQALLFCYMELNDEKFHKYILNAFVDLVVVLQQDSDQCLRPKPRSVRTFRVGSVSRRRKVREEK